jgi:hypothetical protein
MKVKSAVIVGSLALIALASFQPVFRARASHRSSSNREASVRGYVVDLYSYMTETDDDDEAVKTSRKLIRSGVPVALLTDDGLVILGQGKQGPARLVETFAHKTIWAKGRLYQKDGLQYLDIRSVKAAREGEGYDGESFIDVADFDDPDAPPDE